MNKCTIKRLLAINVPIQVCNLHCSYCYLNTRNRQNTESYIKTESAETLRKALSVKRLGGQCIINLTGSGETLMYPDFKNIVEQLLLEGHYIEIVTNATLTNKIDELLTLPRELLDHLEFKCSFHFLQLKEKNLLDTFFNNINNIKKHGASFTIEMVANDECVPYIEEIKEICMNKVGALCHLTVERDDSKKERSLKSSYSKEEYKQIWKSFDSKMFDFKLQVLDQKRTEFCYAGMYSAYITLADGIMKKCYNQPPVCNIFDDIDKPLPFEPVGYGCKQPYCFNAHAFLALGDIPNLKPTPPTYADIRNRKCQDGSEWFTQSCKEAFNTRLYNTNKQLNIFQKYKYKKNSQNT